MVKEAEKKSNMRLGARLLMIGSLALNLLVVGVVGGALISHYFSENGKYGHDRFGSPYVRALSFKDKRVVGREIREAYRSSEVDRQSDLNSFKRVAALLRASPLDNAALVKELSYQEVSGEKRRKVAKQIWVDRIFAMDDLERASYADALEDVLKRVNRNGKAKRN
ncbi:periplasmic heavy metal sensor [Pseudopelagicola sp. nBUS_19]|uniref:periplasmic heavy metal sensor n=1 Tax=unclassified Pseudopelagicola TaxID=2649563 RepID=UPI003EBAD5C1